MNRILKKLKRFERLLFPSPAEREFRRVMGFGFWIIYKPIREFPIKGYYADFYIKEKKLAIEIDGSKYHKYRQARDIVRDQVFNDAGISVARIDARDLYRNPKRVRKELIKFMNKI